MKYFTDFSFPHLVRLRCFYLPKMMLSISLSFVLFINDLAQAQDKILGQVNIASPNAASLGKFGDIPVSYHTGIPNVSIPLYTLQDGKLSVPISLSYHAGGVKVDEMASSVGLGWALNAGGVITRTVKDKPDERHTASLQQSHGYFSDYGLNYYDPSDGANWGSAPASTNDLEPDLFFFNFNGYSGKFYFGDDRTPYLVPEQDLKIEYNYPGDNTSAMWTGSPGLYAGTGYCIMSFTITTPDGTKYYFGVPSTQVIGSFCDPIEVNSAFTLNGGSAYSQVISSWYLQKIVSSDGNSVINFNYTRDLFSTFSFSNPPMGDGNSGTQYSMVKSFVAGVRLDNIQSSTTTVSFLQGIPRKDVSRWTRLGIEQNLIDYDNNTSVSLGGMQVSNTNGTCVKKYLFSQDYFTDATTPLPAIFSSTISQSTDGSTINVPFHYDTYRLRLNSIQELSCDGSLSIPPYTFTYFQEPVLRLFSLSRDHWGFNNGVTTNTALYPLLTQSGVPVNTNGTANRNSSWPAMRAGSLQMITYPTGGTTTFNFEPNKFTVNNTDVTVGGLRIQSINNYDPVSGVTTTTNYAYTNAGSSLSSGVLFSQPTYIQILRNDWAATCHAFPYGTGCSFDSTDPATSSMRLIVYSDNPVRPMNTTQGSHIGYSRVTVSQPGNGYSEYKYYGGGANHNYVAITNITNPTTCDAHIPNYPPAPLPNDFMRGELSYEGHYNNGGVILKEKFYTPAFAGNPITTPGRLLSTGGMTMYELTTAHKSQMTEVENSYQPDGTFLTMLTQTFYESNFHHQPTRIVTTSSDGKTIEKRMKYAFDFRLASVDAITDCANLYLSSRYVNYSSSVLGNPDNIQGKSLQQQFNECSGYTDSRFAGIAASYFVAMNTDRKNFSDCRIANLTGISPLNNYQSNHNAAKSIADSELGPVLWAQDVYYNLPIEETEWVTGNLIKANYTMLSNNRNDGFGVYPLKTMKVDVSSLSSSFIPAVASSANNTNFITKDGRLLDDVLASFNRGRLVNLVGRDGVNTSYDWGYNGLPTVKAVNAANNVVEKAQQGTVSTTITSVTSTPTSTLSISLTSVGTITVSLATTPPSGYSLTASYTITGPGNTNISASVCTGCSGGASSASYSNLPIGQFSVTCNSTTTFTSSSIQAIVTLTYPGTTITPIGTKEFFSEGFEENSSAQIGSSHTGKKYWNSNYTNTFTMPNSRGYTIQWWNLVNGQWQPNQQAYTNGMSLTGPVDDIRIFPSDAQITTYTHEPGIGMTSQTDSNNVTTFYGYDSLGRLRTIRDKDQNILKEYEYHHFGQN
jgi:hypothetical protein